MSSRLRYQTWGVAGTRTGYVYRSADRTLERSVACGLAYQLGRGRVLELAPDGWSLGRPRWRVRLGTPSGRPRGWAHFVVLP